LTSLRLVSLSKTFGRVRAVRGATVSFETGKVHAVVGENGAGKSTMLKMAAGILRPDDGQVWIGGDRLAPHTAREALARGVAMVQQHFALIGVFTALENVVLGCEPVTARGALDLAAARARLARVARELGTELPLDARVETLGVGDRQRVEIARALYRDARVLILDEPTAVLTPQEAAALYATLRRLAESEPRRAVVVVTHKLDEVTAHADAVTVMRRGELVWTRMRTPGDRDARAIAEAIMGGAGEPGASAPHADPVGAPAQEAALVVRDARMGRALDGVSLAVRPGEICGIAGVEGNGQRELVQAIAGLEPLDAGSIHAGGGVAVVHEDRQHEGLVLGASVRDNLMLGELARFSRAGFIDGGAVDREAQARLSGAGIVPPDLDASAAALSGGNQQKIVVARAVARRARALVLAHPTRGVDMGAARAIHDEILACAAAGAAVLVVSADLDELRALSSRILVMARGRVVAELPSSATDAEIGAAMLGGAAA
jgi:simple sugar transport system ATP-binding protein